MHWFEGNIPSAIQTARREGKVLVVYITGIDEVSKKMDEEWNHKQISELFQEHCIALKLEAKSETCAQFSQIYPVVIVPSTYFIGSQGVPIEIVGGHMEPEEFSAKVKQVVQVHQNRPNESAHEDAGVKPSKTTEVSETTKDKPLEPSKLSESQPAIIEGASGTSTPERKNELSKDDKVARAEQQIDMNRRKKAKEEEDKQRNAEVQRRNMGKEAAKLKQWQGDKEKEDLAKNWKKERDEEKVHKEMVRQQIARDRAERAAKFAKDKEERQLEQTNIKQAKEAAAAEASSQVEARKRETTRLQFRLPDGSSITETFASSETLGTAKIFLQGKVGEMYGNFNMMVPYPRRQFTEDDMSTNLLNLQLAPSAALIILPGGKSKPSKPKEDNNGGIVMLILSPIILLWNFIYNLLFGAGPPSQQQTSQQSPTHLSQRNAQQNQGSNSDTEHQQRNSSTNDTPYSAQYSSHESSSSSSSPTVRTRKPQSQGFTSRQEGNIRRFRNNQDDDENNTYNGNSTQQM